MSGTALSMAAFLAIAEACAPGVAPKTLADIARHESGLNPYAVGVNVGGQLASQPTSAAEAIAVARRLLAEGRDFDAGLGQINVRNWRWLGLTVETVFDPCASVAASAAVLTAFSRYNTGSPTRGFANGYVQAVVAARQASAANLPPPLASVAPSAAAASIPATVRARRKGARQLVYQTSEE